MSLCNINNKTPLVFLSGLHSCLLLRKLPCSLFWQRSQLNSILQIFPILDSWQVQKLFQRHQTHLVLSKKTLDSQVTVILPMNVFKMFSLICFTWNCSKTLGKKSLLKQNWTLLEFVEDRYRFAFSYSVQKYHTSVEKSLTCGWQLALCQIMWQKAGMLQVKDLILTSMPSNHPPTASSVWGTAACRVFIAWKGTDSAASSKLV